ncbi:MAG: nucleotide exchange factor GrpE [Syntrophobacterales bacterium]|nr:nucleotide exchange factor GrpE [Syntrophobacterales bacterium]
MGLKTGKKDTTGINDAVKNEADGQQGLSVEGLIDGKNTEELTVKLQEAEKKAAENYDKYLRSVAEFDNYRKRSLREKADAINYGNEKLLQDILPLLDGIDRALEQAGKSCDLEAFKTGLQLLREQFAGCLKKHGVESIDTLRQDFDPNLHEALLQVNSPDHGHNKVVNEFEKGFLLNGRLLRPAKVSVCRRPVADNDNKNECEKA